MERKITVWWVYPGRTPVKWGTRSKYLNKKITRDGLPWDSIREYERWRSLKLLEKAGMITELRRQVSFPLKVGEVAICRYVADFTYLRDGEVVVEDVKPDFTKMSPRAMKAFKNTGAWRIYRIKWKLMKAIHGIEIKEV